MKEHVYIMRPQQHLYAIVGVLLLLDGRCTVWLTACILVSREPRGYVDFVRMGSPCCENVERM